MKSDQRAISMETTTTTPSTSPPPMSEEATTDCPSSSVGSVDSHENNNADRMEGETEIDDSRPAPRRDEVGPAAIILETLNDTVRQQLPPPMTERRSIFGHLSTENLLKACPATETQQQVEESWTDDNPSGIDVQGGEEPGGTTIDIVRGDDDDNGNAAVAGTAIELVVGRENEPDSRSLAEQEVTATATAPEVQEPGTPTDGRHVETDKIETRMIPSRDDANALDAEQDVGFHATTSGDSFVRVNDEDNAAIEQIARENEQEAAARSKHTSSSSPVPEVTSSSPRKKLIERLPHRSASSATSAVATDMTSAVTANSGPESVNFLPQDTAVSAEQPPSQQRGLPVTSPTRASRQPAPVIMNADYSPPGPAHQAAVLSMAGNGSPIPSPSRQVVFSPGVQSLQQQEFQQQQQHQHKLQTNNITMQQQQQQPRQQQAHPSTFVAQVQQPPAGTMRPMYETMASSNMSYSQPTRRCIRLRLVEEERSSSNNQGTPTNGEGRRGGLRASFLGSFRKTRERGRTMSDVGVGLGRGLGRSGSPTTLPNVISRQDPPASAASGITLVDRGTISVSWYDGTGSVELNEHVMRSVQRKLALSKGATLHDVRIIDESVEPSEEIVLCPYIPDGSEFLLKFSIKAEQVQEKRSFRTFDSFISDAPESPSAAPSPHPSSLDLAQLKQILSASGLVPNLHSPSLGAKEIASTAASAPQLPALLGERSLLKKKPKDDSGASSTDKAVTFQTPPKKPKGTAEPGQETEPRKGGDGENKGEGDRVQDVLRQLNELLGVEDGDDQQHKHLRLSHRDRNEEKREVIFVLANYFVLFLSLIVISAEIHERAPRWMDWVNTHVDSVQSCSKDSDSLYKCVSEGNFAGLTASFIFWITRSAATKNILLFGFDSTQKLWTVVYEALVTAVCWGTSYIFIRRGLNPSTRRHFLQKYWKDAIYGSLAGFNAAFLKAVLKNLLPQDQVLDALETRQLRVVDWVSHLFRSGKAEFDDF